MFDEFVFVFDVLFVMVLMVVVDFGYMMLFGVLCVGCMFYLLLVVCVFDLDLFVDEMCCCEVGVLKIVLSYL